MSNGEKEETLTLRVALGLSPDSPQSWGWEIYGDNLALRRGVAASQMDAYAEAAAQLAQFSAGLGNESPTEMPDSAIELSIGKGIIASYPETWAWEIGSAYNGYSWGTADSLEAATRDAALRFLAIKQDMLLCPPGQNAT
ncbi:hypothetical protein DV532_26940 (plasmid) [Pseudomonas sp. Leaf58]|uniref:hypothetical protein n=1 Tax=Pseudomonas sp. Leaf58 TaxID=1736226 RepID=UPI0006F71885|nr:hypothetical protein [Pseudomonas sp. Leaf58]AYG47922.1 hypothetical protein DV532_26940 [Pseudomonas sp. Leaf58]KQN62514.1 hypothetical protein ASF02_10230 [Pseudomonas sp. Leaf58]